jgi:hypothetical protein
LTLLALSISLLLAVEARGPAAEPAPTAGGAAPAPAEAAQPATVEARPGDEGVFLLRSGARLAGRLVSRGADGDVIELRSGERLRFPAGSVVGRLGPISGEPAPGPAPAPGQVRVFLRDGRTVEGDLVDRRDGGVRIQRPDGSMQEFQESEIREVFSLSELAADRGGLPDAARGRYLYVPSAFGLGAGRYRVTATTVEVPEVAYGVTDWLSVSAALIAPLMYGTPFPQPGLTGAVTASVEALPWLRAAGGVRATSGQGGSAVLLFGTVTAGTETSHLSLYAGPPMPEAGRLGRFDEVIVAAAGTVRVTRRSGLLMEAWVTPRLDQPEALIGLGIRLLAAERVTVDVGAMATTAPNWGPWLAVSWADPWGRK